MIKSQAQDESQFINGGGKTGDLIRSIEWSKTPLGAPDTWPQSLKSALSICLNSNFPIAIYWGPELVLLYNEAWSPIPGLKHPWAQGKSAIEVWPEIWEDIEPQFQKAFSGEPGGSRDALLPMQRHGYTEECYFDFTFTPIHGESGKVEGVFNAVIETTYRVINERRSFLLQRLTDAINAVTTEREVFERTSQILNESKQDVPFYYIYKFDSEGTPVLCANSHLEEAIKTPWPIQEVRKGITKHLTAAQSYFHKVPEGFWPELPTEVALLPLKANDGSVFGCIVGGVSSRRKYDHDYKRFYESVANIVAGELNTLTSLNQERKRAQALEEINKAKTAFFSNISHEFRTPLTLMLSPLQAVLEAGGYLTKEHKENLSTSFRNTLRLQKLVNTLLDFSRIEAGRMEANFQRVNITNLTTDLASSFRSAIEKAGIAYRVNVEKIDDDVTVDVDMWEKVVLNLLSNAFKYTEKGTIELTLKKIGDKLVLNVQDTGIGIKEEEKEKIFERFYRVNASGGRSQEGTGIGLSLVKELVKLHEGEITVQSKLGKGSLFSVALPLSSKQLAPSKRLESRELSSQMRQAFIEEATKWDSAADETPGESGRVKEGPYEGKVLVADDNSDMRNYISGILQDDFEVKTCPNGEEAAALAVQWQPDLIVADIMMPKLDGFGLLKKLKATLATKMIPVIFLSARAGDEAKVEGIKAGAADYLVKPFSGRELLARVKNHVVINRTRGHAEKEFFNLFLQSPAQILIMRGPEHLVEFFHPLARPFVGDRDITGMKIREAVPEVAGQGYFEMLDQVYHEGKSIFLPEAKATLIGKDGVPVIFYFNITYVPWRGLDGKIQGVLQFTFDVTEQAKANLKIKESEERFRLLATSIPQIIWIADVKGTIEYLSDQWEKYTGLETSEGMKRFSSLIHEDDIGEVRARWYVSMAEGTPWSAEYRLKNIKTNEYTWFSGYTLPLKDEKGNVMKWIGSSTDITAQRHLNETLSALVDERTAELRRSNEDLQQFAHVTSHDLKEPVRKVKMYANLIRTNYDALLPEKGKEYLNKIEHASQRISSMIDGVLQYSSLDSSEDVVELVDLNEVARNILDDLEVVINEKKAKVKIGTLPSIPGSPTLMNQLFYNLINNSLKFTRDGISPVIEVLSSIKSGAEIGQAVDQTYAEIQIRDNGIGFEQEYAEKIFESFSRLNAKDKFEGTGLGLALCKKIVKRHHGSIKASGRLGEGATFSIYLPVRDV